ncbi:MAG TPA: transcription-repair coupling factor [Actinomycetota bacterium]|nr:transcription-repair coupling factor [Actinomycetota bacterium]
MPQELSDLVQLWDLSPVLDGILIDGEGGLPDVARPFTVAGLARRLSPLVVVLPRSRDAETFVTALQPWVGPEVRVELFPAWEVLPGEAMSPTLETMGRRLRTLWELAGPPAGGQIPPTIVVTSVRAYLQQVGAPPAESLRLIPGMVMSLEEIERTLAAFGYERNYLVERPGEFSVRGGILDVYPPGAEPVRADFFGDELTSLKVFSLSSQRSHADARESVILPVAELRMDAQTMERSAALLAGAGRKGPAAEPAAGPAAEPAAGPAAGQALEPDDDETPREPARRSDLERLAAGLSFPGMEAYLATLAGPLHPPAALLAGKEGNGGSIVICDPKSCRDRAADFLAQAAEWASPEAATMFVDWERAAGDAAVIELWPFRRAGEGIDLDVTGWDESVGQPEKLVAALLHAQAEGATIAVAGGRAAGRAKEVLSEAGLGLPLATAQVGTAVMTSASVERGFLLRFNGKPVLALVGEADLFGRRRPVVAPPQEAGARATALVLQLATGDYVVHETNGVGRYLGMVTRTVAGISRDYLLIEYAGDDRLYVPVENLTVVTKYAGGEAPRLNKLSSGDWEKTRSRARRAVAGIAKELVVLYAKRTHSPGHAFAADTPWQGELEDAFPYLETLDQARAIDEVKADMEKPVPMDRLICGDVGYGKTEIAVRAAFKAVQDGAQVAVLVPTTILAQQHTQTFTERFAGFPVKVAQLSRFLSAKEEAETVEGLATGKVDVVIGTHRLLQKDIKFHELGLLVVDEEQRFGVKHKEALKKLKANVDALALTATPIPRTLEMALAGIRDLSIVDTPPADRRPVLTYVGAYEQRMVTAAIRRELARDGQVFYVHNRVRTILGAARRIQAMVPQARVAIAHGQMSEDELERVMVGVWDGKTDVLVCTTIIESGLDIPTMNTLIVERADRLGLAQLYQLRGRVGRARERAYAYLFYPDEAILTDEAMERLKTLSEFTELGSGFKIALRDLQIRGAGNLVGAEQSGHIAAVGLDLYVKMMNEAIQELSGTPVEVPVEVRIDLPVDAFVPPTYIARESLRIEAYRQIEKVRTGGEVIALREELTDRYGPPPEPTENLLAVAELRAYMAEVGLTDISVRNGVLKAQPVPSLKDSQEVRLERLFPGSVYKPVTGTLIMPAPARQLVTWVLSSLRAILQ